MSPVADCRRVPLLRSQYGLVDAERKEERKTLERVDRARPELDRHRSNHVLGALEHAGESNTTSLVEESTS